MYHGDVLPLCQPDVEMSSHALVGALLLHPHYRYPAYLYMSHTAGQKQGMRGWGGRRGEGMGLSACCLRAILRARRSVGRGGEEGER